MTKVKGLSHSEYQMLRQTEAIEPTLKPNQKLVSAKVKKAQKNLKERDAIFTSVKTIEKNLKKLQKCVLEHQNTIETIEMLLSLEKVVEISHETFPNENKINFEIADPKNQFLPAVKKSIQTFENFTKELTPEAKAEFNNSVDRTKLYAFVSERLNKPLEEISEDEINQLKPDYQRFRADQNSLEFFPQVEEKTIPSSEEKSSCTLTKAQRKKKKYREKQKAAAQIKREQAKLEAAPKEIITVIKVQEKETITAEQRYLHSLNLPFYPLEFKEHPRCVNWRKNKNPAEFRDKNGQQIYQNMTPEELVFVIQQHNLHGADRLLSNEEAVRRHGLSYSWQNDEGVIQIGIKFPSIMRTPNNIYAGEVQLGFDPETKVIFHARFLPFGMSKKISTVNDFREPLEILFDNGTEFEETAEKPWENAQPVTFNSGKNGSLIWEIGERAEHRTTIELARIRR